MAYKYHPATGGKLYRIREDSPTTVRRVVARAEKAFVATRGRPYPYHETVGILRELLAILVGDAPHLSTMIEDETGKSHGLARAEIKASIALLNYYIGLASSEMGVEQTPQDITGKDRFVYSQHIPVGVFALIYSYNMPLANLIWKLAPAILCGNTVVAKCHPQTQQVNRFLEEQIKGSFDPGTINFVYGGGGVGSDLAQQCQGISFTGRSAVGFDLAEMNPSIKLSLEMGGKNFFVVSPSLSFDRKREALKHAVQSAFGMAGQRCVSAGVLALPESLDNKACLELLIDGECDAATSGPLITKDRRDHLEGVVGAVGRKILSWRGRHKGPGNFMNPAVIQITNKDTDVLEEEYGGPVLAVLPTPSIDTAIATINANPYGLSACLWTDSLQEAMHFAHNVRVGTVHINGHTYGASPNMPFGGLRDSGNGSREPGKQALDVYSHLKSVYINWK